MIIKTEQDKQKIKQAAQLATDIVRQLGLMLKPGVMPSLLEKKAWQLCEENGVEPSFFNVPGSKNAYGYSCCISVNDEVLHGIPSSSRVIKQGDIVKIDFGIIMDGYYTDQCFTFIVGEPADTEIHKLAKVGRLATETAMRKAIAGIKAGDLGYTMETIARASGLDTLKMFVGHGIGRGLHEPPEVPSFGPASSGETLKAGMVICVECQVVQGDGDVYVEDDGWTIKTADGGYGAMFEYMVIVGKDKPEIITPMQEWKIIV